MIKALTRYDIKIANIIKINRKELGISKVELANKLNISEDSIYNYEKYRCTIPLNTLREICIILKISLDKVLEI